MEKYLKNRYFIFAIILVSAILRYIPCNYGLPYLVHVDESLIMKDPLRIMLAYKDLDFHITYNLYNYLLLLWHGVIFVFGIITGRWHSVSDYETVVAINTPFILFSFRLLNVLLSLVGDYILIQFIYKKLRTTDTIKLLAALLVILNPVTLNSISFIKFDAFCYIFYALCICWGYNNFVDKEQAYRNKLYIILFLGVSIRIELLSFLAGYFIYDFFVVHRCNLKSFLGNRFIRALLWGMGLYLLITLYPVSIIYNLFFLPKINYSHTKTFEAVILSHLQWASVHQYIYYIKMALVLLSPVVILCFFIKLFRKNSAVSFLLAVLIIDNIVLALDYVKDVWYFLLTAVIILFIFIKYAEQLKKRSISLALLLFTFLYFSSYDGELLYHIANYKGNDAARKIVLNNTLPGDTVLTVGVCDLRILESPKILRQQLTALKETGFSTGYALRAQLNMAKHDSAQTRGIFDLDSDYFWGGTKYYRQWIIGKDTVNFKKLNPMLFVIFSNPPSLNDFYSRFINPLSVVYLKEHYRLLSECPCTFSDPRLYYRNFYYFHSFFIFTKK